MGKRDYAAIASAKHHDGRSIFTMAFTPLMNDHPHSPHTPGERPKDTVRDVQVYKSKPTGERHRNTLFYSAGQSRSVLAEQLTNQEFALQPLSHSASDLAVSGFTFVWQLSETGQRLRMHRGYYPLRTLSDSCFAASHTARENQEMKRSLAMGTLLLVLLIAGCSTTIVEHPDHADNRPDRSWHSWFHHDSARPDAPPHDHN